MKKSTDTTLAISADYRQLVEELKARVVSSRISAARAMTHEAILRMEKPRGPAETSLAFRSFLALPRLSN